ncbi:YicC/YloC family endoribonuclease [Thalassolituus sp.]|jgi:uncharacterized protein (TIGR00255 family)|uniref:YicC/YloC family endoribonuclease n=1 Tax=Thalassolituus sp. TaxID=2030822 RepID=UPI002A7F4223|nr:YicC/YloC family endoribonuclease [Thalassolituus sp.]
MAYSMTAFARHSGEHIQADTQNATGRFVWEVRSVNSRYLELHFRLPDAFRDLEPLLREQLKQRFQRGKIEVFLKYQAQEQQSQLRVNEALVRDLNNAADQIAAIIGPGNTLDVLRLMQWPGVLDGHDDSDPDNKALEKTALNSFAECLTALSIARQREGQALAELIRQRLDQIDTHVAAVDKHMPEALAAQRQQLHDKLSEFKDTLDPQRIEQEMILAAQKADIAEETDRLRTHTHEVRDILSRDEPIGRRLDFMMQELNREANTLSSKSIRSDITRIAVDLKVLIEQMREQVQNIE